MTNIQAGLTVLTVRVVPYIVQPIKPKAITGNVAPWPAIPVTAPFDPTMAMACGLTPHPTASGTSHSPAYVHVQ